MQISWQERLLAAEREHLTEKQLRVIIAAVELFGEQGYADTSTREIAQRAGVSEGSIFKQFPTKKELLLYIIQLIIHNIIEPLFDYGLKEIFEQPYDNLEDFIRIFLQNRLELIEGNVILIKVMLQEAMFQPEIRQEFMQAVKQSHFVWGLESLQQKGLLADRPLSELIGLVLPCFMGFIFSRYIITPEMFTQNKEQDRESFVQFMARGLQA